MVPPDSAIPSRIDSAQPLLAEFDAMYSLTQFRLNALDSRIPLTSGLLAGVLTSIAVLPVPLQSLLLAGLPVTTIYLVRTTIGHARSLQDCLTRIAEIEDEINRRAGEMVVRFQSSHPSRQIAGGRTGSDTIEMVVVASALLLMGCLYLLSSVIQPRNEIVWAYAAYVSVIGGLLFYVRHRFDGYRYSPLAKPASDGAMHDPRAA